LLKPICDLGQVIKVYPDLDWDFALNFAEKLRCEKLFILGLYIAHKTLNISVPDQVTKMFDQVEWLDVDISMDSYLASGRKINNPAKLSWKFVVNTCIEYTYPLKTLDKPSNFFEVLRVFDMVFMIRLFVYSIFIRIWRQIKSIINC
jgi:hypothetical protein